MTNTRYMEEHHHITESYIGLIDVYLTRGDLEGAKRMMKECKRLLHENMATRMAELGSPQFQSASSLCPEVELPLHFVPTPFVVNEPVYPMHMPESRWPQVTDKVMRIKRVRQATGGTGLKECKDALEQFEWNVEEAIWHIQSSTPEPCTMPQGHPTHCGCGGYC